MLHIQCNSRDRIWDNIKSASSLGWHKSTGGCWPPSISGPASGKFAPAKGGLGGESERTKEGGSGGRFCEGGLSWGGGGTGQTNISWIQTQAPRICTSNFAGTDQRSPTVMAAAQQGVKGIHYRVLHCSQPNSTLDIEQADWPLYSSTG